MRHVSNVGLAALMAAIALAGCKKPPSVGPADVAALPEAATSASPKQGKAPPAPSPGAPMLAYDYAYDLRLPGSNVRPMLARHEQACTSAGPAQCQVISADMDSNRDDAEATLKLRASEAWLSRFRAGLDGDAKAAGGRIQRSGVQTEDLTRSIVDTGAAIRAKTMLRDRLERLLAERPGKLPDLLELEQNIAQVQGEIDASQSEMAVMQARVAMSKMTVTYATARSAISSRTTEPLVQAANGFVGNVLAVLAALVTLASFLLPLAIVAALGWAALKWAKRRRAASVHTP